MLDERFLTEWAIRLRSTVDAAAVGVLLRGSHARGAATAYSDVDFDLVIESGPVPVAYPAYLVEHAGRLVHVSVAVRAVDRWLARMSEPAEWAYGLPVAAPARLLWAASEHWRQRLDVALVTHPAAEPELEDLVADLGKVAAAYAAGDELGLRSAAAELARLLPTVLRLANPPVTVACRRAALDAVLGFPVAPPGYRDDLLACAGYLARDPARVLAAAHRLVAGAVTLITPYAELFVPVTGPDFAAALADGRLARYINQLVDGVDRAVDAADPPGPA